MAYVFLLHNQYITITFDKEVKICLYDLHICNNQNCGLAMSFKYWKPQTFIYFWYGEALANILPTENSKAPNSILSLKLNRK